MNSLSCHKDQSGRGWISESSQTDAREGNERDNLHNQRAAMLRNYKHANRLAFAREDALTLRK